LAHFLSIFIVLCSSTLLLVNCDDTISLDQTAVANQNEYFTLRGKINIRPVDLDLDNTRVLIDDGQYVGFLRADGTFSIPGLQSGSYIVEVSSPRNHYESVRVDINNKGKVRARRLNLLQPSDVTILRYPLSFESKGYPNYFHKREQFRVLDILMSPMVIMMVLPLVLIVLLPKLINQDPELQRELQQTSSMLQPNQNMPSLSEIMYNNFGSSKTKKPSKASSGRMSAGGGGGSEGATSGGLKKK
jgi:hypothetical protein